MTISRFMTRTFLGLALVCGAGLSFAACKGTSASGDASALIVMPTSLVVSDDAGHRIVTSLGSIHNPSGVCFEHLVVEVQYFDAAQAHVDTVTQGMDVVAPAGEDVAFRIRDDAAREKGAYVSQTMRVVSADPRVRRAAPEQPGVWLGLFLSWAPMLLLIAVWIFVMRLYLGRKSPSARSAEMLERQSIAIEAQSKLLERIALAMEQRQT